MNFVVAKQIYYHKGEKNLTKQNFLIQNL